MRLDFDWIELIDFKAYQGKHVFDLTQYAEGALHFMRGLNGVGKRLGSNGAGKSTLLGDAVTWCLYGQTAAGLKNPDVKPWHFKGKTSVRVCCYRGKDKIIVGRTINPNGQTLNGKEAGADDIERAIGMSFNLFINTILLAQGRPLFFDLTPADKMKLFVDALTLDRWDMRAKAAGDRVAELAMQIAALDGEAEGLRKSVTTIERLMEEEEGRADMWDTEYTARIKKAKVELLALDKEMKRVIKERDTADLALEAAEMEKRHYAKEFTKTQHAASVAALKLAAEQQRADAINIEVDAMTARLKSLGEGDTCSQCGQSLKGTALAKHRKQLDRDIDAKQAEADSIVTDKTCEAVNAANALHEKVRGLLIRFTREAEEARDKLDTYDRQAATISGTREGLDKLLSQKEAEPNPHRAQVRTLKLEHKKANGDIAAALDDRINAERKQQRAKFWVKGFKDIRVYVLGEIMQELELATNAMLDEAGLVGWDIRFELERETARGTTQRGLNISVRSPQSDGHVKWESWSGGEAQRLRVVGALALSEVLLNHAGINPSLEVLDEPTQHLSPEGVRDLCEYLSGRAARLNRQVFYVDQAAIESRHFASVTTIAHGPSGARINS